MGTLLLASFDKNRLRHKKVLIVLDDVNDLEQLDTLIGDCSFGPESRIIVTTRDKQLLKNLVDQMYQIKELTYDEALQLFHMSLKGITPPAHLAEVIDKVVYHSGGIPRVVKFLGFLFCSKDVENWDKELEKLKKLLPGRIEDFLTTSYNQLDEKQKTIFLDIACFFKGNDKDFVERILDGCELFASTGIVDLIDKCLITTMDKQLRMFDLVQSMGWEIVRKQCIEEPGKRSRIWLAQDVCHVLTYNTGIDTVEGILLNMSEIIGKVNAGPTVFEKMYKLRFLKFHNNNVHGECKVYFPDGLHSLPNNLVYLHWDQYPLTSLPPNFIAKNLVEINMRNSQVEKLWSGVQRLEKLKKIDLSYSKYLTEIPDLSEASNLEYVYLDHCKSLYKIPASFQYLDKLDTLMLEGCSSLKALPELAPNIRCLVLNKTAIEEVPLSIGFVSKLEILCLRDCQRLVSLPTSICKLKSLNSLCLSGCSKLKTFPEILEPMACLTILELEGTGITEFPFSVRNLIGIQPLNVNILENSKLIPRNMCKLEFSKCLSLHQLHSRFPYLDRPVYYLHEKHGETVIETVSISRGSLIKGSKNRQLCGRQFLLYNCFKFGRKAHNIAIADNREDAKSFHKEIGGSKLEREFSVDDFGIFCPGNGIPNWFRHQSEGSSISTGPRTYYSCTVLGFAICVVIDFTDNYTESREFKVICQPNYTLSDGHKLSCDFHGHCSSDESDRILSSFLKSTTSLYANGGSLRRKIIGGEFEFFCVDENYELLEGCVVQRCGIQPLSSTSISSATLTYHPMFQLLENIFVKDESEPCASGSEFDNSNCTIENEEDRPNGCIPLEVVSISSSTLKRHFETDNIENQNFQLHNFLQVHKRACNNGTANNPKVKVFDREISLSEFKRELVTGEDNGSCCLGNEMNPNWFSYQSQGSSLDVYLPPNWPDANFLGFVVCAVINIKDFSLHDHQRRFKLLCQCHYICEFPYLISWDFQWDHGCIAYCEADDRSSNLDRKFPWNLDGKGYGKRGINRFPHNGNVAIASFNFWCVDENNQPVIGYHIKQCGIQLLYAEQLDLINDQNFFKLKQEDEEEEEEEEDNNKRKFEPKGSGNGAVDFELKGKEDSKTSGCRPMEVVSTERSCQQFGNEFQHSQFEYYHFFKLHQRLCSNKVDRALSKFECEVSTFNTVLNEQNRQIFGYDSNHKMLKEFAYQSEGSSITVDIPTPCSPGDNLIGFLVSAIVEFEDCCSDCRCVKLLCRPHYIGKFPHLLSWDFHGDHNCVAYYSIDEYNKGTDFDENFLRYWFRNSYYVQRLLNKEEYKIVGVSFDFWCVDENYEPLEGCIVRRCAVEPLTLQEKEEEEEEEGKEEEEKVDDDIKIDFSGQLNGVEEEDYEEEEEEEEEEVDDDIQNDISGQLDGVEEEEEEEKVDGYMENEVSSQLSGSDYEEEKGESYIEFGTSAESGSNYEEEKGESYNDFGTSAESGTVDGSDTDKEDQQGDRSSDVFYSSSFMDIYRIFIRNKWLGITSLQVTAGEELLRECQTNIHFDVVEEKWRYLESTNIDEKKFHVFLLFLFLAFGFFFLLRLRGF